MSKKILIVDDKDGNRKLFTVMLQKHGYETLEAENGKRGIELAKEHIPHLILMDIQMPIMDGLSALKILKSDHSTSSIPVIAITSYAKAGGKEKFLSEGFDGYISKPVNIKDFIKTVREILERISNERGNVAPDY
ncbi:MAG: response regulator [Nitrospirota bacterium]